MTTKQLDALYYQKKDIERLDKEIYILENDMQSAGAREPERYDCLLSKIVEKNNERAAISVQVEETERFIKSLSNKDQLIIRYRYEDRMSWNEIADAIGHCAVVSIMSSHYRAIKNYAPNNTKS